MSSEIEVRSPSAMVAPREQRYPLADISEPEFQQLLERMKLHYRRMRDVQRNLMTPGVHYGVPGLKGAELKAALDEGRVGLYKAGAELLLKMHGYVATVEVLNEVRGDVDNADSPALSITVGCKVHRGSAEGEIVGTGVGAANSWEVKHRFRNAGRKCPNCGKHSVILSKWDAKGGPFKGLKPFICPNKSGGCGFEFAPDDERLVNAVAARQPNPDAYDLENTLLKMAAKRAKVDATIAATATSDLFTQDLEDMDRAELKVVVDKPVSVGTTEKPAAKTADGAPTRVDLLKRLDVIRDQRGLNDSEMLDLINATLKPKRPFVRYSNISGEEIVQFCTLMEEAGDGAPEA